MLRTGSQRRKLCRACPIARVADLVGDPCSLLIMRDVLEKPKKFSELEDSLGGMSPRTLTLKLKRLEHEGLIVREGYMRHPPRHFYAPTRKGIALRETIDAMRTYGKKYL